MIIIHYKDVSDTSLAEVTERKLQNPDSEYLLINFPNSSFRMEHPDIRHNCLITIIKNNDEINLICLGGIDSKLALECWLEHKLNLSQLELRIFLRNFLDFIEEILIASFNYWEQTFII